MCSAVIHHLIHFYQPSGGSVAPNDLNCRFWPKIDHFWAISETQPVIQNVKKCVLITRVSSQSLLKPLKLVFTFKNGRFNNITTLSHLAHCVWAFGHLGIWASGHLGIWASGHLVTSQVARWWKAGGRWWVAESSLSRLFYFNFPSSSSARPRKVRFI